MGDDNSDGMPSSQDYACAIGSAILALNTAESELFEFLQQQLDWKAKDLEPKSFAEKVDALERFAKTHQDVAVRGRLLAIVSDARRLGDERNNFAHGLLWFDPFDGRHQRRWVPRRTGEPERDMRTPREIIEVGLDIDSDLSP